MADDFGDIARKFGNLAYAMERGNRTTVEEMSFEVKKEFEKGPPRSGLGRGSLLAGRPWRASFNVRGSKNAVGLVFYRGPVHWIERGTKPHRIAARAGVGARAARSDPAVPLRMSSRKSGARAVKGPKGPSVSVPHPGTGARPFMSKVKRESRQVALAQLQRTQHTNILRAGFGR